MKKLAMFVCLGLLGCSGGGDVECRTQNDCFADERCESGECVRQVSGTGPGGSEPGGSEPGQPSNGGADEDVSPSPNPPDDADGNSLGGEEPVEPVPTTSCVVAPLTACVDPTGELDTSKIESGLADEEPEPGNRTFFFNVGYCSANPSPGQVRYRWSGEDMLCEVETADFFRFVMYHCSEHDLILEVSFTLEPVCHEDEVGLEAYTLVSGEFVETPCSPTAPCERRGAQLIRRFVIPAGTGTLSHWVGIVSNQEHMMFKYTIEAEARVR